MPIMASRGVLSVRGFGMFGAVKPPPVGTQGILAPTGTSSSVTTKLYTWANDGVAASTNLRSSSNIPGGGCGIPVFAIIPLGALGKGTNKYVHANAGTSASTALPGNYSSGGAFGNTDVGLFVLGSSSGVASTTTYVYQYSNDSTGGGGALVTPRAGDPTVLGDNTRALITGSTTGNAASAAIDAYTYSNNTCAPTTSLLSAHQSPVATGAGNDVVGIFNRTAASILATQKYTYAANTVVAGTALASNPSNGQSCGSSTAGIFINATTTVPFNKYLYANDTVGAGATMTAPTLSRPCFVANGIAGVSG